MSLLHIGVALGLSAAAAFLVTGAAMRPIEPDAAATCPTRVHSAVAGPACVSMGSAQPDRASDLRHDAGGRSYGR